LKVGADLMFAFRFVSVAREGIALGRAAPAILGGTASQGEIAAFTSRIVRVGGRLEEMSRQTDESARGRIVDLMQASAPVRTGGLRSSIEGHAEGDTHVVTATVHADGNGIDYAPLVEFGTDPHALNASRAAPRRGKRRPQHPGTDPQPFFWPSAERVLGERRESMGRAVQSIAEEGL
jgi:hypothetical protein